MAVLIFLHVVREDNVASGRTLVQNFSKHHSPLPNKTETTKFLYDKSGNLPSFLRNPNAALSQSLRTRALADDPETNAFNVCTQSDIVFTQSRIPPPAPCFRHRLFTKSPQEETSEYGVFRFQKNSPTHAQRWQKQDADHQKSIQTSLTDFLLSAVRPVVVPVLTAHHQKFNQGCRSDQKKRWYPLHLIRDFYLAADDERSNLSDAIRPKSWQEDAGQ
ncbi:hypothetical protein T265_11057 [Opisthorchis viverrini]|uniref:Uncharacterized protein n=1 Tax=Opisthorchis viverrini TaxID=6198 RepID=A0A074Z019_OPIVI|nr:hypothetical protein T265_11057 [Opisthorchis viverrini]KER20386.1 hypothetical protein T265_11057 [Opisthorchis viverrini]